MNVFAVVRSSGKRIHARECCERSQRSYPKGHFQCIDCSKNVLVRRGNKRMWHFSHYSSKDGDVCPHKNGGETEEHYSAKHFIAQNIHRCVFWTGSCSMCRARICFPGANLCVAEVEKRIPGTNKVADVLLMSRRNRGAAVAAVEVFHTHEVDPSKHDACRRQRVAVLEVTTEEVQRARTRADGVMDISRPASSGSALVMRTVDAKFQLCVSCSMLNSWQRDLHDQQRHWAEYDRLWADVGRKHQQEYVAREMANWLRAYETEAAAQASRDQVKRALQDHYTRELDNLVLQEQQHAQAWADHGRQAHARNLEEAMLLRDMRAKNEAIRLQLEEKERKRRIAEEECARKRQRLYRVLENSAMQKDMYVRRKELLKSMQERSIAEGLGMWNNETYWKNFHKVTGQLLVPLPGSL
jgi:hypothetical protein